MLLDGLLSKIRLCSIKKYFMCFSGGGGGGVNLSQIVWEGTRCKRLGTSVLD
jgi:hypothetical protein